jgi:serine/threonine protein kinase
MPQSAQLEQYSLLKPIGFGAFGTVFLAKQRSDGQLRAIKVVSEIEKASQVERSVLQSLKHPFIVSTECSFLARQKVHISMEYLAGGTLHHRLATQGPIPVAEAKLYLAELALAIDYLHQRGIVYRDLKSENVMIGLDGHLKLVDFGLSTESDICYRTCGTWDFLAPEIIAKRPYGQEVDWWALGILFYEMLFQRTPFAAVDRARQNDKILHRPVVIPQRAYSNDVRAMIYGLLHKNPKYRYGYEEIVKDSLMDDMSFSEVYEKVIVPRWIPEAFDLAGPDKRKSGSTHRESFQSGDGKVGQARSYSAWRASMILLYEHAHVKSLS